MKKIIKFILVLLCMITIFSFSSDKGLESSKKSSYIISIIEKLTGKKYEDKQLEVITFMVRKTAHFTIYFLFGFLLVSLFREYFIIDKKKFLIVIFLCMLYACSDEVHQLFVSNRSGKVSDVLLDTVGSFLGIVSYMKLFLHIKIRKLFR